MRRASRRAAPPAATWPLAATWALAATLAVALAAAPLAARAQDDAGAQGPAAAPSVAVAPDAAGGAAAAPPPPAAGPAEPPAPDAPEDAALPEAHRPRLRVTTRPDRVSTGDLVTLRIEADVPDGDDVTVPEQSFAPFEVHARRVVAADPRAGRRTFRFELDLLALEPGEHSVGPVALRVVTADGTVGRARTEALPLRVESVLGNTPDAQPKPPTDPVPFIVEDYTALWVLAALALVLLTALTTWLVARWWGRRARAAAPPPPPRPPHELALEKLGALRRELGRLIADGREQELVDRTSDALREYLGGRYGFDGLESTTDEIVARLRRIGGADVPRDSIAVLLGECDLVKFAKVTPDEAQCARLLEGAIDVVRQTAGLGAVGGGAVVAAGAAGTAPGAGAGGAGAGQSAASEAGAAERDAAARASADTVTVAHADRRLGPAGELVVSVVGVAPAAVATALEDEVRAGLEALATDVGFSGDVRVVVGHELPETDAARAALTAVLGRLAPELAERRTARGLRLRVTVEHLLEAPSSGAPVRKAVYELPTGRGGAGGAA